MNTHWWSFLLLVCGVYGMQPHPPLWIHMIQGETIPPQWFLDMLIHHRNHGIWLTFEAQPLDTMTVNDLQSKYQLEYIHLPNSTWTQGRNAMYTLAQTLPFAYEYFWFYDDDVVLELLDNTPKPLSLASTFRHCLRNLRAPPAVLVVQMGVRDERCRHPTDLYRSCTHNYDAIINAFHHTSVALLHPYDTTYDTYLWWVSQAILITMASTIFPHGVFILPGIRAQNTAHRTYPRGMVSNAELQQTTQQLLEQRMPQQYQWCKIKVDKTLLFALHLIHSPIHCTHYSCCSCIFQHNYTNLCGIHTTQSKWFVNY